MNTTWPMRAYNADTDSHLSQLTEQGESVLASVQLALCPSPSPEIKPIPYGLVSLLDMINFSLNRFVWMLKLLNQEFSIAADNASRNVMAVLTPSDKERFTSNFREICDVCNALVLQTAVHRLGHIFVRLRDDVKYVELAAELEVLSQAVQDDIQYEIFYHYPRAKGQLVFNVPAHWQAALASFPSAKEDIEAAVDCYALGHNNASIYHSMMVLECGLPALAKKLKVTIQPKRNSWGPIIDDIRAEIDARGRRLAQTPRGSTPLNARKAKVEKQFLEACQEAAIEFRYFADVWRNHIAHGRGNYDENDAKKVLDHVRSYMETISRKLNLRERT